MAYPGDTDNKRIEDADIYDVPHDAQEPSSQEEQIAEEQLTLADEDERLPWLESEDDVAEEGVNTSMIVTVALVGLALILAVIGGIWLMGRDGPAGDVVADGSTIEAPDEPYKTRPADPGGVDVAGTGAESFEQGEGQTREAQIAAGDAAPAPAPSPGIDRTQGEAAIAGIGVQIGAYSNRADAQTGWNVLSQRYEGLQGLNQRIVEGQVDGATVYRLQAVAGTLAAAQAACQSIKAAGGDCQVKR